MLTKKRKPASIGETSADAFMRPMGLTQGAVEAMGARRIHVDEPRNTSRALTSATARILARAVGDSPDV